MLRPPEIVNFDIKLKKDKFIKLKIIEGDDRSQIVHDFCMTYKLSRDREIIILQEVNKFFERREIDKQKQNYIDSVYHSARDVIEKSLSLEASTD